ncbi:MAG: DUF2148 domain-containing protein [Peptococcaceae bacterium]|nr:DUF2148 domain-containing protein [Peptococcaceae bacterium]
MDIIKTAAEFMAMSALTAPKTRGRDSIATRILSDPSDLETLAAAMEEDAKQPLKSNFGRDAKNIRASRCVVFVYLKEIPNPGLNCGACGFPTCEAMLSRRSSLTEKSSLTEERPSAEECSLVEDSPFMENPSLKSGPFCAWQIVDLGIATGSAVKTASLHNVDNRIMYSAAQTACRLGFIPSCMASAIPLQATSKSIYFDR